MKTKIITLSIFSLLSITCVFAQDKTTVNAYNSEISDNLDLRAVASIFGDSKDLEDFERRLNNPETQISNLDLNQDNQVDYLRVIETIEGNTHLIVIQSVLGHDTYQDVATIEVDKDRDNKVQVQVVGDVYMYGSNYIYEPVYVNSPIIYASFWVGNYHPYYSSWHWDYYPRYYYGWAPFPIFRYRSHIGICINNYNHYNYVNYRRCEAAYNSYYRGGIRGNAYETQNPTLSFSNRNNGYSNRYELDQNRNTRTISPRSELTSNPIRENGNNNVSPRGNSDIQNTSPRNIGQSQNNIRNYSNPRNSSPRIIEPRGNINYQYPRISSPRQFTVTRGESPRSIGNIRGNRRS
jgi:hypothetical protein